MGANKLTISDWFKELQDDICAGLEKVDGQSSFKEDRWTRSEGGGGRSRVMNNGQVIEKGGVNFSAVEGMLPEKIQKALDLTPSEFYATGVSVVIHPQKPTVPIIHMNVRYFETKPTDDSKAPGYWFGGGIDVTPHYIYDEDARFFHLKLKDTCDSYDKNYYPLFKKWADDYFFLQHRNETRGIGGIFFDQLREDNLHTKEDCWNFVKGVGKLLIPVYTELVTRNIHKPSGEKEKQWQMLRRGRYVEFNLVWDKGTKFGLDTNGRTESILMSMPPMAEWIYNFSPKKDSAEERTLSLLKKGIDWTK